MTDAAILAALRASVGNPDALEFLALAELCLSQPATTRSHAELRDLLDRWGHALVGIDAAEIRRLKTHLGRSRDSGSHGVARQQHEGEGPEN